MTEEERELLEEELMELNLKLEGRSPTALAGSPREPYELDEVRELERQRDAILEKLGGKKRAA